MNNADLIVRALEQAGVRWVFGIPSDPVLPLVEALRRSPVEFVLTASETSAGFMASTVGRLTGVPGVCVSTLGPGATNLATGVGCAWLDRSPLIAITCNVATPWIERRTQMRIDHHLLFQPLTKATFPLRAGQVAESLGQALALSCAEPPGPVHLDLPVDVALAETLEAPGVSPRPGCSSRLPDVSREVAKEIAVALGQSRKPLLVTGLTFTRCRAGGALLGFVEGQNIPFATTLHAKGSLPESHPNWVGVLGRARRSDVHAFVRGADLILAIGYDPIEMNYEEWVGDTSVVHISTELAEASPGLRLVVNRAGDLDRFLEGIRQIPEFPNDWRRSVLAEHRRILEQSLRPRCQGLAAHRVLDLLRDQLPPDGILAYDVGAHTHQIATQWRTDLAGSCLATNGWSSMGYGMPAAYAAKLVYPDRAVVGVIGDGCFQMTVGELATIKRLGLTVPVVVLNDGWLGLIKVKQERKGYGCSGVYLGEPPDSPPHYFGVPCRAVRDERGLADALRWALALNGPSVIEAFIAVEPYSSTVFD